MPRIGPRRSRSYRRLRDYCSQNELEPRAVLSSLLDGSHTLARTAAIQDRYQSLLDQLAELDGLEGLELVDALWPADVDEVQDVRRMAQGRPAERALGSAAAGGGTLPRGHRAAGDAAHASPLLRHSRDGERGRPPGPADPARALRPRGDGDLPHREPRPPSSPASVLSPKTTPIPRPQHELLHGVSWRRG